ncbi:hypothetical protein BDV41DRAFT_531064 [Aspergillus transmontanensis]|uniref:Uncharacterized protein n=1 Tax=Aspergillus transmontanensis TaxID=1034304 RepID=A0A5N6W7J7_9EURO|nr:hypothetical protein BDV41DRAFT_531064 [Aspergillus transmontanensis]
MTTSPLQRGKCISQTQHTAGCQRAFATSARMNSIPSTRKLSERLTSLYFPPLGSSTS